MADVVAIFRELALIDSPSKAEVGLSGLLASKLSSLGARVWEDGAGTFIDGTCGNRLASIPGQGALKDAPPILLSAHMDTVAPTAGIRLEETDGWIHTDGSTILGADDKAGIAVILAAVGELVNGGSDMRPVEIAFTIAEEIGLYGAKYLALDSLESIEAIVLDSGSRVGSFVTRTPAQDEVKVVFIGRAAHAGVEPEKGINAIRVAAEAIAAMPNGRIDGETTANVGVIHGGVASNVVPDMVTVSAEARSRVESKLDEQVDRMREACRTACESHGAKWDMTVERSFPIMDVPEDHPILEALRKATESAGLGFETVMRGGGSDANILNRRGIVTVNMGLGMENDHSGSERIAVDSLCKAVGILKAFLSKKG